MVDGTLQRVHVAKAERYTWTRRKPFLAQNILASVDFNGYFTCVVVIIEGLIHGSRLLRTCINSRSFPMLEGKFWLADARLYM
jgi:hypothetical protein